MEFLKFNKSFAQTDIENRIKFQSVVSTFFRNIDTRAGFQFHPLFQVKHHLSKEYSAQKDHRKKKSLLSKVKKQLQNQGRHRMRWKIKKMRRERKFPQMPGKRDKYRQYGFIPKIQIPTTSDCAGTSGK